WMSLSFGRRLSAFGHQPHTPRFFVSSCSPSSYTNLPYTHTLKRPHPSYFLRRTSTGHTLFLLPHNSALFPPSTSLIPRRNPCIGVSLVPARRNRCTCPSRGCIFVPRERGAYIAALFCCLPAMLTCYAAATPVPGSVRDRAFFAL